MPQVDRLLEILASTGSDALNIAEGEPVTLRRAGAVHPVTTQPVNAAHWRALAAELVAPVTLAAFDAGGSTQSTFTFANVVYTVGLDRDAGVVRALVSSGAVGRTPGDAGSEPAFSLGALTAAASPAPQPPAPILVAPNEPWRRDGSASAREAMDGLLREQVRRGASDLHLRSGRRPILRTSGDIVNIEEHDPIPAESLGEMLHAIMPERHRREFHELNDTDFAYELEGAGRFRVNALHDRHGPAAVSRSIPSTIVTADQLGLSAEVQGLCNLTKGLVLVTGPTGSGKSTTLSALVDLVNRTRCDHIVTIEDPIEFVHESKGCLVTQRQVGMHTTSFKHALRAALREDPDVVLVGELRDLETVGIAIETAETGHLVFATMHTSTAASTVERIVDQFPADRQEQIRIMLAESLKGVIAQTLCRKIGGGRVAAMEILLATPAVSNLIRESKTFQIQSAMQTSRKIGMVTLTDALLDLVDRQKVEPKEAYLRAIDKVGMATALKGRGVDVSFLDSDAPVAPGHGRPDPSSGVGIKPPPMRTTTGVRR